MLLQSPRRAAGARRARLNDVEINATCSPSYCVSETYQAGIRFDTGRYGKTDVVYSTGHALGLRAAKRKSHCHRETGRSDLAKDIRLYSQPPSHWTNSRQIVSYIKAQRATSRISTPSAARWPTACPTSGNSPLPRPGVFSAEHKLPTERSFPGMPQGRPEHIGGRLRRNSTRKLARHGPSSSGGRVVMKRKVIMEN